MVAGVGGGVGCRCSGRVVLKSQSNYSAIRLKRVGMKGREEKVVVVVVGGFTCLLACSLDGSGDSTVFIPVKITGAWISMMCRDLCWCS